MSQLNETLQRLIDLQQLDNQIRDLSAEIDRLPKEIAEIESTLAQHIARVEADKKALSDNQMSRRKREGDITALRDKISHLRGQTTQVKTNEQYKAMLHEIEFNEQQIVKVEDQILAEMEASEALAAKLKEAEASLASERTEVAKQVAAAKARKAEDEKILTAHRAQRETLKSGLDIGLFERYERILKGRKGLAVVPIIDTDCCEACNVRMRPAALGKVYAGSEIVSCESCTRILYIPPPEQPDVPEAPVADAAN
jgi:predicted  nucleic acid-binding Zn-ribbon protein